MNNLKECEKKELAIKIAHFMDDQDYHYPENHRKYKRIFPYNLAKIALKVRVGKAAVRTIINNILDERRHSEETVYKIDISLEDKLESIDSTIIKRVHGLAENPKYWMESDGRAYDYDYLRIGKEVGIVDQKLVQKIIYANEFLKTRFR